MAHAGFTLRLTGQAGEEKAALAHLLEIQLRSRGYAASASAEEGGSGAVSIEVAREPLPYEGGMTPPEQGACVEIYVVGSHQSLTGQGAQAAADSPGAEGAGGETSTGRIVVHAAGEDSESSAARIMAALEERRLLPQPEATGYTHEDEEEVRRRLEALGYV